MDLARGVASPFLRRNNSESRSAALRRQGSAVIGLPGPTSVSSAPRNNLKLGPPHSLAQGSSNSGTPPDGSGLPRRSRSGAPVRAAGMAEAPCGKPGEQGRRAALPSLADWGRGANLRDIFDNSPAKNRRASDEHWKMACSPPGGRRSAARRQRSNAAAAQAQEAMQWQQWQHEQAEQQEEELQSEVEKLLSAALTEPSLPSFKESARERSRSLPSALKHHPDLRIGSMHSVTEEKFARIEDDHGDYENSLQRQGTGFVHLSAVPEPSSRVRIDDSHGDYENGIQRKGTGFVHFNSMRGSSPSDGPHVRIDDSHGDNENNIQRQGTGFVMFHHVSPRVRIMDSHGDNENRIHRQGTGFVHLSELSPSMRCSGE
mmetsp:Transcript_81817/g.144740  ORF Transcript_81817/g.144740 Transcript_81817/m.144740 type:complete len:373 (+) Transcript_81817:76-1194(+)